ncbi:MAG: Peptidase family M50 [Methanosaeta sp. PtaU1.Bin112]|nr:MAG: Peptidase family M50 [Methanosaeta sp. PtaU1.Bin112]
MSIADRISTIELKDLLLSLAALVIAFSVLINGRKIPDLEMILIITVGVGTGFLLHEMAHKFMALHFGYFAEYRANPMGLLFAVVASFAGFIFAAPGAVMISKPAATQAFYMQDPFSQEELRREIKKETLWISLAGPITNIVLTAFFFIALMLAPPGSTAAMAANFALFINLTLAAFNLIPIGPLDGKKIFDSNRTVWLLVGLPTILIALPIYFGIL